MILTMARPKRETPPPVRMSEHLLPVPVTARPLLQPVIPSELQTHAARSAIDWQGTIQHEVRAQELRSRAPPRLRFDFPLMPAPQAAPAEFAWDERSTDRIQRLTQGVFDFGQHCFIRLWPPVPQCHFEPANGDLFKHMHGPRPLAGPNTPP